MTDNNQLHTTHDLLTGFKSFSCGCLERNDGNVLTYCQKHNPKSGTHGNSARKYA